MKILCLSDLHLFFIDNKEDKENYIKYLKYKFENIDFDCIVISGDIFEYNYIGNPYLELRNLFSFIGDDKPIICCLGNHEFAYRNISKVLKQYSSIPKHARYNVYYLDVDNNVEFNRYTFVGNVFWYDYTLSNNGLLKVNQIVDSWLDSTIENFIPTIENDKCKKQIFKYLSNTNKNVVVTHMVPHESLNTFSYSQPLSLYNAYSGCKDFLSELKDKNVVAAICGHTHRKEMKEINGIICVNIGNDYYTNIKEVKYYVLEV